ncbi:MAG: hypothetical protein LBI13_03010 [Streptococcaceae bacterium]|jgi:hypothetical protein|nr:hypothetical protein [Streptococcaceae bacterium]
MAQKIIQDSKNPNLFYIDDILFSPKDQDIQRALFFEKMRGTKRIFMRGQTLREIPDLASEGLLLDSFAPAAIDEEVLPLSIVDGKPHFIFEDSFVTDSLTLRFLNESSFRNIVARLNRILASDFFGFRSEFQEKMDSNRDFIRPITFAVGQNSNFFKINRYHILLDENRLLGLLENTNSFEKDQQASLTIFMILLALLGFKQAPQFKFPVENYFERSFSFEDLEKIENHFLPDYVLMGEDLAQISKKISASYNYWYLYKVETRKYFDELTKKYLDQYTSKRITEGYRDDEAEMRVHFQDSEGYAIENFDQWDYAKDGYRILRTEKLQDETIVHLTHEKRESETSRQIRVTIRRQKSDSSEFFEDIVFTAEITKFASLDVVTNKEISGSTSYLCSSPIIKINSDNQISIVVEELPLIKGYKLENEKQEGPISDFNISAKSLTEIEFTLNYHPVDCQVEVSYYDYDNYNELIKTETLTGPAFSKIDYSSDLSEDLENFELYQDNLTEVSHFLPNQIQRIEILLKHQYLRHQLENFIFEVELTGLPEDFQNLVQPELRVEAKISAEKDLVTGLTIKSSEPELLTVELPSLYGFDLKNSEEKLLTIRPEDYQFQSYTRQVEYKVMFGEIEIKFVDRDRDNQEVAERLLLSGQYGQQVNQDFEIPEYYRFDSLPNYDDMIFSEIHQQFVVGLRHMIEESESEFSYTAKFENIRGEILGQQQQNISYNRYKDLVTDEEKFEALQKLEAIVPPSYYGYKLLNEVFTEYYFTENKIPENETIKVLYEPLIGQIEIKYVDSDADDLQVGEVVQLSAPYGSTPSYEYTIPELYELAKDEDLTSYKFSEELQTIILPMKHVHDKWTESINLKIEWLGVPIDSSHVLKTIEVECDRDEVTGIISKSAATTKFEFSSPSVYGYALKQPELQEIKIDLEENDFSSELIKVEYERLEASVRFFYIDTDTTSITELVQVGEAIELTGYYGESVEFEPVLPENYELAEPLTLSSVFFSEDEQEIQILLKHAHEYEDKEIIFEVELKEAPTEELFISKTSKIHSNRDLVTGENLIDVDPVVLEIELPEFYGYTHDQESSKLTYDVVAEVLESKHVNVRYEQLFGTISLVYFDADETTDAPIQLGPSVNLTGTYGQSLDYELEIPEHMELISEIETSAYKFGETAQVIEVGLKHKHDIQFSEVKFEVKLVGAPTKDGENLLIETAQLKSDKDLVSEEVERSCDQTSLSIRLPEFYGYLNDSDAHVLVYDLTENNFESKTSEVNYFLAEGKIFIRYFDGDDQIGKTLELIGHYGEPLNYELAIPAVFELVGAEKLDISPYKFGAEDQEILVQLKHKHEITRKTSRFKAHILGGPTEELDIISEAEVIIDEDLVTRNVEISADPEVLELQLPEFYGYVNDSEKQLIEYDLAENDYQDMELEVYYEALQGEISIQYFDLDGETDTEEKQLFHTLVKSGPFGQPLAYHIQVPENFKLDKVYDLSDYRFGEQRQVIEINLIHEHEVYESESSFEVILTGVPSQEKSLSQTTKYKVDKDLVTTEERVEMASEELTISLPEIYGFVPELDVSELSYQPKLNGFQNYQMQVNYVPLYGKISISYRDIEGDKGDDSSQVGETLEFSGQYGEVLDYEVELPENYEALNRVNLNAFHYGEQDQEIRIQLAHKHELSSKSMTLMVELVGIPTDSNRIVKLADVQIDKDLVTGNVTKSSKVESFEVELPELYGYSLLDFEAPMIHYNLAEHDFESAVTQVRYKTLKGDIFIKLIDRADEKRAQVGETIHLMGSYGSFPRFELHAPDKYSLVNPIDLQSYKFSEKEQVLEVELEHQVSKRTKNLEFTVIYENEQGDELGRKEQEILVHLVEDLATEKIVEEREGLIETVISPEFEGYSLGNESQREISFDAPSESEIIKVLYRLQHGRILIKYVDLDSEGHQISKTVVREGRVGGRLNYHPHIPENYVLEEDIAELQFTQEEQILSVGLRHQKKKEENILTFEVIYEDIPIEPNRVIKQAELVTVTDLVTGQIQKSVNPPKVWIRSPEISGFELTDPEQSSVSFDFEEYGYRSASLNVAYRSTKAGVMDLGRAVDYGNQADYKPRID